MNFMTVLLLGILANAFLPWLITTNSALAGNPAPILQDRQAPRGYSAVGRVDKESGEHLYLVKNPCTTTSRVFYVKFKQPYIKRAVTRPPCPNGQRIEQFFVEQQ